MERSKLLVGPILTVLYIKHIMGEKISHVLQSPESSLEGPQLGSECLAATQIHLRMRESRVVLVSYF